MMNFLYTRVSTSGQNDDRQQLEAGQFDEVFADKASGGTVARPELQRLLGKVRVGDTVTVLSIDRLARNVKDLLTLLDDFTSKGVKVHITQLGHTVDNSPMGKLIVTLLGAVAEMELAGIRERQAQGIAIAKEAGVYKGRTKVAATREKVAELMTQYPGMSNDELAKLAGCGVATVYRIKKELRE
ncbi:recombinase family protein [Aeromonas intestinalis]